MLLFHKRPDRFWNRRLPPLFCGKSPLLIGYARVSKTDGSQVTDLQRDALTAAGVAPAHLYQDEASGQRDDRPGLAACLKALRAGDILFVWKLDRLGRDLRHLVNTVQSLADRGIGFKVLAGQGADIDNTTTASGKLVFGIFAALAEFERELIRERTKAGLASGRKGGRRFALTKAQVRLAQAAMGNKETRVRLFPLRRRPPRCNRARSCPRKKLDNVELTGTEAVILTALTQDYAWCCRSTGMQKLLFPTPRPRTPMRCFEM